MFLGSHSCPNAHLLVGSARPWKAAPTGLGLPCPCSLWWPAAHTTRPSGRGQGQHPQGQHPSCVLSTLRLCRRRTGGLHPLPGVLGCMVVPALAPARLGEAFTESIFPSKLSLQGWLLQLKIALKFNCLSLVTPFSGLPSTSLCLHVPCRGGQDAPLSLIVLQPASPQPGMG